MLCGVRRCSHTPSVVRDTQDKNFVPFSFIVATPQYDRTGKEVGRNSMTLAASGATQFHEWFSTLQRYCSGATDADNEVTFEQPPTYADDGDEPGVDTGAGMDTEDVPPPPPAAAQAALAQQAAVAAAGDGVAAVPPPPPSPPPPPPTEPSVQDASVPPPPPSDAVAHDTATVTTARPVTPPPAPEVRQQPPAQQPQAAREQPPRSRQAPPREVAQPAAAHPATYASAGVSTPLPPARTNLATPAPASASQPNKRVQAMRSATGRRGGLGLSPMERRGGSTGPTVGRASYTPAAGPATGQRKSVGPRPNVPPVPTPHNARYTAAQLQHLGNVASHQRQAAERRAAAARARAQQVPVSTSTPLAGRLQPVHVALQVFDGHAEASEGKLPLAKMQAVMLDVCCGWKRSLLVCMRACCVRHVSHACWMARCMCCVSCKHSSGCRCVGRSSRIPPSWRS